jgi:hypothetical protein
VNYYVDLMSLLSLKQLDREFVMPKVKPFILTAYPARVALGSVTGPNFNLKKRPSSTSRSQRIQGKRDKCSGATVTSVRRDKCSAVRRHRLQEGSFLRGMLRPIALWSCG